VARSHGLDANLVRKWLGGHRLKHTGLAVQGAIADKPASVAKAVALRAAPASATPSLQFVPIGLPAPSLGQDTAASAAPTYIHVELRGSHASVVMDWPASQAPGCAVWLGLLGATVLKP
jgi:hypothetical protein